MAVTPSTTAQDFWEWLNQQGYTGSQGEQLRAMLTAAGFATGSLMGDWKAWLESEGFTGTLNEMINNFERVNTIQYG